MLLIAVDVNLATGKCRRRLFVNFVDEPLGAKARAPLLRFVIHNKRDDASVRVVLITSPTPSTWRRRTCEQHKRYVLYNKSTVQATFIGVLTLTVTSNNNTPIYYKTYNLADFIMDKDDDPDDTFICIMISATTLLNL